MQPGRAAPRTARRARPGARTNSTTASGVLRRLGVGHRHDRGEPAERGGAAAGLDRLGLLAAGLAQVDVEVDEARARRCSRAASSDVVAVATRPRRRPRRPGRPRRPRRRSRSPGLVDAPSRRVISRCGSSLRVARRSAASARRRRAGRNSTAIRTATPLVTCWVITEPGQLGRVDGHLDAAVHRARVHHQGVRPAAARPAPAVRPYSARVLAQARHAAPRPSARAASAAGTARRARRPRRRGRAATSTGQPSSDGGSSVRRCDERDVRRRAR